MITFLFSYLKSPIPPTPLLSDQLNDLFGKVLFLRVLGNPSIQWYSVCQPSSSMAVSTTATTATTATTNTNSTNSTNSTNNLSSCRSDGGMGNREMDLEENEFNGREVRLVEINLPIEITTALAMQGQEQGDVNQLSNQYNPSELVQFGERSVAVVTRCFELLVQLNEHHDFLLFPRLADFLLLLLHLTVFPISTASLISFYSQLTHPHSLLSTEDPLLVSLSTLSQPLTFPFLASFLQALPESVILSIQQELMANISSMAVFWAEMKTRQKMTSHQRILFVLDVVALIYRCPRLFLEGSMMKGLLIILLPSLLLQNAGVYQEIEVSGE